MPCMASSKNRPKKSQQRKKAVPQPKKKTGSAISDTDDPIPQDIPAEIHEPGSGTGAMGKMRGLISGAEPVKEGFFTRRRTLGEWLLWLGAGAALYYAYHFFSAGE